jgi:membrane protein
MIWLKNYYRRFCSRCSEILAVIDESVTEWNNDNVPRLAAALAFYTLLSLSPLLVIVIAIGGLLFGRSAAAGQLAFELQQLLGLQAALAIEDVVRAAYRPGAGTVATSLSLLTLVIGATGAAVELRDSLNIIWHVPAATRRTRLDTILGLIRERFYSFALVLGSGLLLLVSITVSASIAAMGSFVGYHLAMPEFELHLATSLFSFLLFGMVFAAIYKVVPSIPLQWGDVIVGAAITSFLFTVGKLLIGIYVGKASFRSSYGAAGSAVVLLVWVYYSTQLFFLGAEFTKVYARKFGSHPSVNTPESFVEPST